METLLVGERKTFQGAQTQCGARARGLAAALHRHIFFHPDCAADARRLRNCAAALNRRGTVGSGIAPDLLTSAPRGAERSRAASLA
jgi:hypothetical protein